jgi:ParB-like chromosome segregation protein Spo0J
MKAHPAAELLPELEGADFVELLKSIQYSGQQHPIIVWKETGLLVDGRNRLRACQLMGLEPLIEHRSFDSEAEVIKFIMDTNLTRRHLPKEQRAFIAAELVSLNKSTQKDAAKKMHVSVDTMKKVIKIKEQGSESLINLIKAKQLSITAGAVLADLTIIEQEDIISQGVDYAKEKVKELKNDDERIFNKIATSFAAYAEKRGIDIEDLLRKMENNYIPWEKVYETLNKYESHKVRSVNIEDGYDMVDEGKFMRKVPNKNVDIKISLEG